MKVDVRLTVNEVLHEIAVEPRKTLLAVLREGLSLTGTKEGCSTGDCGACTVLLDGKPATSCLVLAVEADGRDITTVEGVADRTELHPIQEAMIELGGLQCGFCTPGIIVSSFALLQENNNPKDDQIRRALAGNLCRCTGYTKVVAAVKEAGKMMRKQSRKRSPRKV
jgi:carbon-monoxide dehydrogenase small subunit